MDINNLPKAFCVLPWMHSQINPDSNVNLCCIANSKPMGNLKNNTLKEIFQGPAYNKIRKEMLTSDKLPEQCYHCTRFEEAGKVSMRQTMNEKWKEFASLIELDAKEGRAEFKQLYLDYRFTNKCNFACITCGSILSSAHAVDERRLNQLRLESPIINVDSVRILEEIKEFKHDIERIYFAGGEPTIAEHHYDILQLFIDSQQKIEIFYNTNFSHLFYKNHDLIDLWNKINGRVILSVSIDGFDKWGEAIRYGLDAKQFASNVSTLIDRAEQHIELQFTVTVSVANYRMVEKIVNWLDSITKNRYCHINFGPVIDPLGYSLDVLTPVQRKKFVDELEDLSTNFSNLKFSSWENQNRRDSLKSLLAVAIALKDHEPELIIRRINERINILDERDQLRNTNWRMNLPKLARDWKEILVYNSTELSE